MNVILPGIQPRALNAPMAAEELSRVLRTCSASPFSAEQLSHYIQRADHDIKLFDNCIERLRERQAALQHDIAQYSSLLSPIRKLPAEILRRILGYACTADHSSVDPTIPTFAFRLSSVCSRWREVALHSPELWATLSLSSTTGAVVPVRLALSRSQQIPLCFRVCEGWDETRDGEEVFNAMVQHAPRWLVADFNEENPDILCQLRAVDKIPILESIACTSWKAEDIFYDSPLSDLLSLKELGYRFEYCTLGPDSLEIFPWANIRHLDMDFDGDNSPATVFECLGLGHSIQSLAYCGIAAFDGLTPTNPYTSQDEARVPVTSNLHTLTFRLQNEKGFYPLLQDFLRGLTLPNLTNLTIRFEEDANSRQTEGFGFLEEWPRSVLRGFLDRSGCTLTSLVLEGMPLADTHVLALLNLTPSLQSFTLSELWASVPADYSKATPLRLHKTVTRTLLQRLDAPAFAPDAFTAQHPLLPKLKYLKLAVQSHFDSDQVFVEMIRSRWDRPNGDLFLYPTERLRTVVLHVVNRKLAEGVYEPLKRLDEEGLMITVFGDGIRVV
ncbi:hypothetical protein V5O48_006109 [Marasmius crinis-equi]|uniref:F-box domain-containing protein n=1 Tax=Marasmius crinis-equi TaxID=585013 RepID=A0ABR3FKL6_9AGAR